MDFKLDRSPKEVDKKLFNITVDKNGDREVEGGIFNKHWPELYDVTLREIFLWNCTAFPVANNIEERLIYLIEKCGKDLQKILDFVNEEMDNA